LLCDGCDRGELRHWTQRKNSQLVAPTGFHIYCLDPPLAAVPKNEEWYCTPCLLSQGDDFGFEEGEEHSIPSFQARDEAFAEAWWNRHRPEPKEVKIQPGEPEPRTIGGAVVSEDDVEREFWRLTESQADTVEVEYGADVHSTTHGR
jgi:histone demethylase JARID1